MLCGDKLFSVMNMQIRTDLALEAKEMYTGSDDDGILSSTKSYDGIEINSVWITNEKGSANLGKPMGTYITLEMPKVAERNPDFSKEVTEKFSEEIRELVKPYSGKGSILVAGLGNWNITPDALGPKVISGLLVTRHLKEYMPDKFDDSVNGVCAISPGVLGITGIETNEIIKGIVERVKPSAVIAIDALASRRVERVNTTIQISDTGISPGAGVGNRRGELSEKTIGVPVIAVGVPTVVDAATIAMDALETIMDDDEDSHKIVRDLLSPYYKNLIVAPKNMDAMITDMSTIIAAGLNMALQDGLSYEDALNFKA